MKNKDDNDNNKEISGILNRIAIYLGMQEAVFQQLAYEKAAFSIEALEEDVNNIYSEKGISGLEEIPSIGKSIAKKI